MQILLNVEILYQCDEPEIPAPCSTYNKFLLFDAHNWQCLSKNLIYLHDSCGPPPKIVNILLLPVKSFKIAWKIEISSIHNRRRLAMEDILIYGDEN